MKDAYFMIHSNLAKEEVSILYKRIVEAIDMEYDNLHLMLNSPGGSVRIGLGLANFISTLPCNVITYNISAVDSAAVMVFSAGKERICAADSRFYIHCVGKELSGLQTIETLKRETEELQLDTNNIASFLSKRTEWSPMKWKMAMRRGTVISPDQAKRIGLVTSIGISLVVCKKDMWRFFSDSE